MCMLHLEYFNYCNYTFNNWLLMRNIISKHCYHLYSNYQSIIHKLFLFKLNHYMNKMNSLFHMNYNLYLISIQMLQYNYYIILDHLYKSMNQKHNLHHIICKHFENQIHNQINKQYMLIDHFKLNMFCILLYQYIKHMTKLYYNINYILVICL